MQKTDTPKTIPVKYKQIVNKQGSNTVPRCRTIAKGNLEDILHAIYIEESPIFQAKDIEYRRRKMKKCKNAKKLDFLGDDTGFIFQPRKTLTRHTRKVMESSKETDKINEVSSRPPSIIYLSSPAKEELVIKQRNGKDKIIEKSEIETLKERLKEAHKEISVLKEEANKHRAKKVQFSHMRKI